MTSVTWQLDLRRNRGLEVVLLSVITLLRNAYWVRILGANDCGRRHDRIPLSYWNPAPRYRAWRRRSVHRPRSNWEKRACFAC